MIEILLVILVVTLRLILGYQIYQGLFEIIKLNNNKLTWFYIMGLTFYSLYTFRTSVGLDVSEPLRIVGIIGLNVVIYGLLRILKLRSKDA